MRAARQPKVVAIGGGHGLETLLRGLKTRVEDLTAIVTVADDGGSSGVLRRDMGMLPPGDLRRCIAALADAEPLMALLFEYRFGKGTGLQGHAFGNLFIAAMAGVVGDFERAIVEVSRVLAVSGRVLPSSLDDMLLCAEVRLPQAEGERVLVRGQARIAQGQGIVERVYLEPDHPKAHPEAVRALLGADLILFGPGSLFTSVLPNLLVPEIADAVAAASALKVYVCNVATQRGETEGFSVGDHVSALEEHLGPAFCDCVLANASPDVVLTGDGAVMMVPPTLDRAVLSGMNARSPDECEMVTRDLVDRELLWRHDAQRLGDAVLELYRARAPS